MGNTARKGMGRGKEALILFEALREGVRGLNGNARGNNSPLEREAANLRYEGKGYG